MTFAQLCTLIVVSTLIISYFLIPILWDAVGHIETVLNTVYHIELITRVVE